SCGSTNKFLCNVRVQGASAREFLDQLEFSGDETVLDSGFGDGSVTTKLLAEKVPRGRVLGIDPNARMGDWARAQHERGPHENVDFFAGDIRTVGRDLQQVGIDRGSVDFVFSNYTHHWMFTHQDKEQAYRSIAEILRDGGRLADRHLREGSFSELVEPALEIARSDSWKEYFHNRPIIPKMPFLEEVQVALEGCDFAEVSIKPIESKRSFPNRSELTRWFAACFRTFMTPIEAHHTPHLLAARRKQLEFAREVIDQAFPRTTEGDGALFVTEKLTEILAVR
ncbi:class I SAM-dependent methyltransferase, partial [bacterium]|nr:class I SAM-dependent methyltransferase [bacterium]